MPSIVPVLLSGGAGARLWPLSREAYPKQLLPLAGAETMLQQTARRARDPACFAPPLVTANAEHWSVVNGTALVTRDGEELLVREKVGVFAAGVRAPSGEPGPGAAQPGGGPVRALPRRRRHRATPRRLQTNIRS